MNENFLKQLSGKEDIYPHILEERFPRVFEKIVELWGTPSISGHLQELMVNKRGGARAGFPAEVATELFRLSNFEHKLHEATKWVDAWGDVPEYKRNEVKSQGYDFAPLGFLRAIEDGNKIAVSTFISCGFDLEIRDERNWTPLMISAFYGHEDFALLLVKSGADIMARDKDGYNPLHWAAFSGYTNVIKMLLQRGARVNSPSDFGWTALMQAATQGHLLPCGHLIAAGADVNLQTLDGWTALHKAANNGHTEIVKLLLSKGANRYAKFQDGSSPIDLAIKAGHKQIIALLHPGHALSV
jgi:hypothetical protein